MLDSDSFERLWKRSEKSVLRVASQCGSLRCVDDREDLLQRVHLRAWNGRNSFSPDHPGSFTRWVCQIAARTCLDSLREAYRARRLKTVQIVESEDGTPVVELVASDDPTALDEILADERMGELRQAIAGMPEAMRTTLRLTIDGLEPKEIAAKLGIKVEAVRSRLYRARHWVHEHLA